MAVIFIRPLYMTSVQTVKDFPPTHDASQRRVKTQKHRDTPPDTSFWPRQRGHGFPVYSSQLQRARADYPFGELRGAGVAFKLASGQSPQEPRAPSSSRRGYGNAAHVDRLRSARHGAAVRATSALRPKATAGRSSVPRASVWWSRRSRGMKKRFANLRSEQGGTAWDWPRLPTGSSESDSLRDDSIASWRARLLACF